MKISRNCTWTDQRTDDSTMKPEIQLKNFHFSLNQTLVKFLLLSKRKNLYEHLHYLRIEGLRFSIDFLQRKCLNRKFVMHSILHELISWKNYDILKLWFCALLEILYFQKDIKPYDWISDLTIPYFGKTYKYLNLFTLPSPKRTTHLIP